MDTPPSIRFDDTLITKLGIELVEAGPERVVATMPVAGNTQPYGILHGGASAALCETVASIGSALRVGPERRVMGIELNINHIRMVKDGAVTATGIPLHAGRTTSVWDVRVHDRQDRLVAAGRVTVIIASEQRT